MPDRGGPVRDTGREKERSEKELGERIAKGRTGTNLSVIRHIAQYASEFRNKDYVNLILPS